MYEYKNRKITTHTSINLHLREGGFPFNSKYIICVPIPSNVATLFPASWLQFLHRGETRQQALQSRSNPSELYYTTAQSRLQLQTVNSTILIYGSCGLLVYTKLSMFVMCRSIKGVSGPRIQTHFMHFSRKSYDHDNNLTYSTLNSQVCVVTWIIYNLSAMSAYQSNKSHPYYLYHCHTFLFPPSLSKSSQNFSISAHFALKITLFAASFAQQQSCFLLPMYMLHTLDGPCFQPPSRVYRSCVCPSSYICISFCTSQDPSTTGRLVVISSFHHRVFFVYQFLVFPTDLNILLKQAFLGILLHYFDITRLLNH